MDIQFRKGTEEYLDSCIKAMEHSSISTAYFLIGKKLLEFIENILFKRRDIFLLVGDYNPDAKIFMRNWDISTWQQFQAFIVVE